MQEQVRVTLDQPGEKGGVRKVDASCVRRYLNRRLRADCCYAIATHEHDPTFMRHTRRRVENTRGNEQYWNRIANRIRGGLRRSRRYGWHGKELSSRQNTRNERERESPAHDPSPGQMMWHGK
jgi:hypothetical protein